VLPCIPPCIVDWTFEYTGAEEFDAATVVVCCGAGGVEFAIEVEDRADAADTVGGVDVVDAVDGFEGKTSR